MARFIYTGKHSINLDFVVKVDWSAKNENGCPCIKVLYANGDIDYLTGNESDRFEEGYHAFSEGSV